MDFFKKSLTVKVFFDLLIVFVFILILEYAAVYFVPVSAQKYLDAAALFLFFVAAFLITVFNVHKPLKTVFQEMKFLLTGKPYKKIFTNRVDEVGILAHFFNEVTKNIERISVDVEEGKRMSKELAVGSDIQNKILPKEVPAVPGIKIFGRTRPASEVGGDSFDVIPTMTNNTFVYIGDVTGHGLPAGLIMVMVNTLIRTFSEVHANGYDIIVNTNRVLKQRIEPRRFMTAVLLRWNDQEGKLYYTGAGHEHICIYHKKENKCEIKQTGGIALGMVPDVSKIVKEENIPFDTGDKVILYSDGIIEAKNMQGEMFGLARLQKSIEQHAPTSDPEALFTTISKDFGDFVGDQIQEDDITLIVLQRI